MSATTTLRPAERAAQELLEAAWSPDAAGGFLVPVDPYRIARRLGVRVHRVPLDEDVSGMLVKRPDLDAEIYINAGDSANRQRFSCAHELGHFDMRASTSKPGDEWGYVDRRGPSASRGTNRAEIYANQFAAELLMPQQNVRRNADRSVTALAAEFGVSPGAMAYRLENLGLPPR